MYDSHEKLLLCAKLRILHRQRVADSSTHDFISDEFGELFLSNAGSFLNEIGLTQSMLIAYRRNILGSLLPRIHHQSRNVFSHQAIRLHRRDEAFHACSEPNPIVKSQFLERHPR